jgi:Ca2+-binding EF-hand superfamily protein
LTSEELRHVLIGIAKMPEDEVNKLISLCDIPKAEEMIQEADPGRTGKINYQEFADHLWTVIQQFAK